MHVYIHVYTYKVEGSWDLVPLVTGVTYKIPARENLSQSRI